MNEQQPLPLAQEEIYQVLDRMLDRPVSWPEKTTLRDHLQQLSESEALEFIHENFETSWSGYGCPADRGFPHWGYSWRPGILKVDMDWRTAKVSSREFVRYARSEAIQGVLL